MGCAEELIDSVAARRRLLSHVDRVTIGTSRDVGNINGLTVVAFAAQDSEEEFAAVRPSVSVDVPQQVAATIAQVAL